MSLSRKNTSTPTRRASSPSGLSTSLSSHPVTTQEVTHGPGARTPRRRARSLRLRRNRSQVDRSPRPNRQVKLRHSALTTCSSFERRLRNTALEAQEARGQAERARGSREIGPRESSDQSDQGGAEGSGGTRRTDSLPGRQLRKRSRLKPWILLKGTTREELEASADKILSLVKKPDTSDTKPDFDGGAREPAPDPETPEQAHNKEVLRPSRSSQFLTAPSESPAKTAGQPPDERGS
jgi:hypothetical protein